ncbi:MAG: glycosyltransferase family 39 protein [Candidatus Sumerlaeota bacterium]|nr:glycosyltransferase family 39 protein [Candidatus Sumerlaeota bacterium]
MHRQPDFERIILALLALLALTRLLTLGAYPLMDTTESRYAEVAREMVATGDWITPRLDLGHAFLSKPPLSYWLTAICFKVLGLNEFAARLSPLLLSAICVILAYFVGLRLLGPLGGMLGAVFLGSSGMFYILAGCIMTDLALMAGVTISLASFVLCIHSWDAGKEGKADEGDKEAKESRGDFARLRRERLSWGYLFFFGLAFSLMSKGPVGWVLTLLPIFVWTWYQRRWRDVARALPWAPGLALALVLGAPWFFLAERANPGFLSHYFIGEHIKRFIVPNWDSGYGVSHNEPHGMIWVYLLVGSLPWSALAGAAFGWQWFREKARPRMGRDPWLSFMALWLVAPAIFFTPSRAILYPYVLPAAPGCALLCAMIIEPLLRQTAMRELPWFLRRWFLSAVAVLIPVVYCCIIIFVLNSASESRSQKELIQYYHSLNPDPNSALVFFKLAPYSAQFYSNGGLKIITEYDVADLDKFLKTAAVDYFVFSKSQMQSYPPEKLKALEEVKRFGERDNGKYILLREIKRQ